VVAIPTGPFNCVSAFAIDATGLGIPAVSAFNLAAHMATGGGTVCARESNLVTINVTPTYHAAMYVI